MALISVVFCRASAQLASRPRTIHVLWMKSTEWYDTSAVCFFVPCHANNTYFLNHIFDSVNQEFVTETFCSFSQCCLQFPNVLIILRLYITVLHYIFTLNKVHIHKIHIPLATCLLMYNHVNICQWQWHEYFMFFAVLTVFGCNQVALLLLHKGYSVHLAVICSKLSNFDSCGNIWKLYCLCHLLSYLPVNYQVFWNYWLFCHCSHAFELYYLLLLLLCYL